GIRDRTVTGVQTCALPISGQPLHGTRDADFYLRAHAARRCFAARARPERTGGDRGGRPAATGQPYLGRMKTIEASEVGRPEADRLAPRLVRAARREVVD